MEFCGVTAGKCAGTCWRRLSPDAMLVGDMAASAGNMLSARAFERKYEEHESDVIDIPATVLCARCGTVECMGCYDAHSHSGIQSLVAWERSGGLVRRLWATACAATEDSENFFRDLPKGSVVPAIAFAWLCEFAAVSVVLTTGVLLVTTGVPPLGSALLESSPLRILAAKGMLTAIPLLTVFLLGMRLAYGIALYRGAGGAKNGCKLGHFLRFAFYASGWDLVISPVGLFWSFFKNGARGWRAFRRMSERLHDRSARAFLEGRAGLYGTEAEHAVRVAYRVIFAAMGLAALLTICAIYFVAF